MMIEIHNALPFDSYGIIVLEDRSVLVGRISEEHQFGVRLVRVDAEREDGALIRTDYFPPTEIKRIQVEMAAFTRQVCSRIPRYPFYWGELLDLLVQIRERNEATSSGKP